MQSALSLCEKEIRSIADSDLVINSLKLDLEKISKILPSSQNELFEDDFTLIRCITKTRCEILLQILWDRFFEPELLFAFRIFNAKEILNANQRQLYENHDLKLLITRFNVVSSEQILKVVNEHWRIDWLCQNLNFAGMLLQFVAKLSEIKSFRKYFPKLHRLWCIALSIPLQQPDQSEGFQLCTVLKLNNGTGCLMLLWMLW